MNKILNPEHQEIRNKLPGFTREEILCCDTERGKKLVYILSIRGCFDELITVTQFNVHDASGQTWVFTDLNEAVKKYTEI